MFIKYLSVKSKYFNNLGENIEVYLYNLRVRNCFLKVDTKRQTLMQKLIDYLL